MKKRKLKSKKYSSTIFLLIGIVLFLIGIVLIKFFQILAWTLIIIATFIIFRRMFKIKKVNKKLKNE